MPENSAQHSSDKTAELLEYRLWLLARCRK